MDQSPCGHNHTFKVSPSKKGGEFGLFQKPLFNSSGTK